MTAPQQDSNSFQGMLDWLEGELRQVKTQLAESQEQAEQNRAQVWDLADQVQKADGGAANLAAQINVLSGAAEDLRALRERVERLQGALGQDQEQVELLGRQLRAEMQSDRDERGELRRRTEFAEQAASTAAEKLNLIEEVSRRVQDDQALLHQRFEQMDINIAGLEARIAANAEAIRRGQTDDRNTAGELERHERGLAEIGQRLDRFQEAMRRAQEAASRFEEMQQDFAAIRELADSIRQSNTETVERTTAMVRDNEALQTRFAEFERGIERARARDDQQERVLGDLRNALDEARDQVAREFEKFLSLQEKGRQRQMADIEQELREIRGYGRKQQTNG